MANNPTIEVVYGGNCPDCASRQADLPQALPDVGDDFDWLLRDFDSFRLFMLEELVAKYPERTRWTPADVETALVEVMASLLDRLSDSVDRVFAEGFLETARRPESVRRLLKFIGYDVLQIAKNKSEAPFDTVAHVDDDRSDEQRFDQYWLDNPTKMQSARIQGPREIQTQKRMVTLDDYVNRLEEHPLVLRAYAAQSWSGSWSVIKVAVIAWLQIDIDSPSVIYSDDIITQITEFHQHRGITLVELDSAPTIRTVLRPYLDAYRLAGQEVVLQNVVAVGITISLSIQVSPHYFKSELRQAVEQALSTDPGGFFEPGRLRFGEDLHAGDIFQALMAVDGVENVCLNRFKRIGERFADQSDFGRIKLSELEVAVCDNNASDAARGYYRLKFNGGRKG
jgi:hypothetical protein